MSVRIIEGSCQAGDSKLICGANHLTDYCMVRVFIERRFQTDFGCLIFCQHLFHHWINVNVAGLSKLQMFSFLSIHADT